MVGWLIGRYEWENVFGETFAAEYVKCFGKCVPNVVDERSAMERDAAAICTQ